MTERIQLDPEEVAGLVRGAGLLDLRPDTPPDVRRRSMQTALTAMDALCGLVEQRGPDGAWDVLGLLRRRELRAFASLMATELERAGVPLAHRAEADAVAPASDAPTL